jgi:hypothetical protein
MRPFLLRRLKKDVAKQLPGKYEHIVMCKLSKRQQQLYEEFMARSATRSLLKGGNFMSMMNVLMQLRKVCNHPDLFEPRPITSPLKLPPLVYEPGALFIKALDYQPLNQLSNEYLYMWRMNDDAMTMKTLMNININNIKNKFINIDDISMKSSDKGHGIDRLLITKTIIEKLKLRAKNTREYNYNVSEYRSNNKYCLSYSTRMFPLVTILTPMDRALISKYNIKERATFNTAPCLYNNMILSINERADQCYRLIKDFVFVLPSVIAYGVSLVSSRPNRAYNESLVKAAKSFKPIYENCMRPFYLARIRQSIFFPDRKLVQYDSGKLQHLCTLLHERKAGGHKCLIFTQMSKMLDILEIFLTLNAHTYVRLDGSTGVEKRQKLMDKFNTDPKLFCFILSTRSGGLGINLTGADTVIFYDSDWNPAMDAQAQDRAHRIGQTRDVHIYRLVSESTVEENILVKAKQKRHLDFLVMTEGNFSEESLFNNDSLKDMLGMNNNKASGSMTQELLGNNNNIKTNKGEIVKQKDIEAAMAAAEDEEDVSAIKVVRAEAASEGAEFDENVVLPIDDGIQHENDDSIKDPDDSISSGSSSKSKKTITNKNSKETTSTIITKDAADEQELQAEFASWQAKVGPDFQSLFAALRPIERYALNIRTHIDPYYSMFFLTEQQRLEVVVGPSGEHWDVDEIERAKEEEEQRALEEGELLAANVQRREVSVLKRWYIKERMKRIRARRLRVMIGAGWSRVVDVATGVPFWLNADTGEASYNRPILLEEQDAYKLALDRGYAALPEKPLLIIMSYLSPLPHRNRAALVCIRWYEVSQSSSLHRNVLSVESCARDEDKAKLVGPNTFATIESAIAAASPGDTISLGCGHHWETTLVINKPLRIIGTGLEASRCVIELTNGIHITKRATSFLLGNVTIRRPRRLPTATSCLYAMNTRMSIYNCVFNNDGATGAAIYVSGPNSKLDLFGSTISGGAAAGLGAVGTSIRMRDTTFSKNNLGLVILDGVCAAESCKFIANSGACISVRGDSAVSLAQCDVYKCGSYHGVVERPEDGFFAAKSCSGDNTAKLSGHTWAGTKRFHENTPHTPHVVPVSKLPRINNNIINSNQNVSNGNGGISSSTAASVDSHQRSLQGHVHVVPLNTHNTTQ